MSKQSATASVSKRTVFGSKLNQLRSKGSLPANIFGKGVESLAVQMEAKVFGKLLHEVGETGLIKMEIDGGETRNVLISDYDHNPLTGEIIHVDFRQVNLKEVLAANVPILLVGKSPAVDLGAIIVQSLDELEVEALPTDFPENIEVDISVLAQIGDVISVGDLKVSDKITLMADPEIVIVMAQEVKEEVEEEAPAEAAPVAAEGEVKPEGGEEKKAE